MLSRLFHFKGAARVGATGRTLPTASPAPGRRRDATSGAKRPELLVVEAREPPRLDVERRAQFRRAEALRQVRVGGHRLEPALRAQPAVPAIAGGDMADLVAQDDVQDLAGLGVADAQQLALDGRGRVEPA